MFFQFALEKNSSSSGGAVFSRVPGSGHFTEQNYIFQNGFGTPMSLEIKTAKLLGFKSKGIAALSMLEIFLCRMLVYYVIWPWG